MAVTITDKNGNIINKLTQWDSNVSLYIHGLNLSYSPVVHFSNKDSTKSYAVGSTLDNGVIKTAVPNVLLEESQQITIHIYTYDTDTKEGRTIEVLKLSVEPKKKPDDYIYTENIEVVNVVALNNQIKDLKLKIPTGAVKNGNTLSFTTTINGVTTTLFSVDLT